MMDRGKTIYYQQEQIADDYEWRRFGRGGGPVVAEIEQQVVAAMLDLIAIDPRHVALDFPCGTGRFLPVLARRFSQVVGGDRSMAMLGQAQGKGAGLCLCADASAIPLRDASIHFCLVSRFVFHFQDPLLPLAQAARVLVPGGHLLFDAYNWTPRHWIPGSQGCLGGRTFLHKRETITSFALALDMDIVAERPTFLVAPYLYGFLPARLVRFVEARSALLPSHFRAKTYYLLRKRQA